LELLHDNHSSRRCGSLLAHLSPSIGFISFATRLPLFENRDSQKEPILVAGALANALCRRFDLKGLKQVFARGDQSIFDLSVSLLANAFTGEIEGIGAWVCFHQ